MSYRDKIRYAAEQRGIACLMHFTQSSNLPGIMAHGLLSRADRMHVRINAVASAPYRLDDQDHAVSVSISAFNPVMFDAKRAACRTASWAVLLLAPSILWTHECRFHWRNAATREMRDHNGFQGGAWAFAEMFSDRSAPTRFAGTSYRCETQVPDFLTTRSAAEVQVLQPITPEHILGAWVDRIDLAEALDHELKKLPGGERMITVQDLLPRFTNGYDAWG